MRRSGHCWRRVFILVFILFVSLLIFNIVIHAEPPCRLIRFRNERLPKIIHVTWKNMTVPKLFERIRNTHLEHFPEPEFQHLFWTDAAALDFMKTNYPDYLDMYVGYPYDIQRADSLRYFVLHFYGGLYLDMDYEVLGKFWNYLPDSQPSVVESPYQYSESVQNSLMTSPRKHPMWIKVFDQLEKNRNKAVFASTGPNLFDNIEDSEYNILDCRMFQRIPHEFSETLFLNYLHRESLGRVYPMKNCLQFDDPLCPEFTRHHALGSYFYKTGLKALLWSP